MENKKDIHRLSIKSIRPIIAKRQSDYLLETGRYLTIPRAIVQIIQECKKC
jgi:hypothetical protein